MCYFSGVVDIVAVTGVYFAFAGLTFCDNAKTGEQ